MITWHSEIDHSLLKRKILQEWHDGTIPRTKLCDADSRLVSAARFHGINLQEKCPVCRGDNLRLVWWIFGENLGHRSGTACSEPELAVIVNQFGYCTVKEVEVCPDCKWSFLIRTRSATRDDPAT